ncbi:DUF456 family protein, partial [Mycolicibacterium moriokaense]|uniref:DUF456 family protein n=1 Tax=Mycolicibacterium moriokaense TaxID=39691 RepID=UPI001F302C45
GFVLGVYLAEVATRGDQRQAWASTKHAVKGVALSMGVELAGAQRAVRQVISLIGAGRPVITHCFAGKDRTGFTVATVLEA